MTEWLLVLSSNDSELHTQLAAQCGTHIDLHWCRAGDEVAAFSAAGRRVALLIDARNVRDGGHACGRIHSGFVDRFPHAPVALLGDENCPEPLERLVYCEGVQSFSACPTSEGLAAWLGDEGPDPARPSAEPVPVAESDDPPRGSIASRVLTQTVQMRRMLEELEVAAQHDVTVLLIGETGSGKTYLSRLIHEASPRCRAAFLPVACGALSDELIESELFGHAKGSFTSAHADKDGKFLAAGRGTILLDEIDVLSLEQQVKLLRVMETGEFEPVGSNRTLKSEARIVVASNMDLEPLVESGTFRMDLYYRLNMLKFHIPPLRRRKPDIPLLAEQLVDRAARKHNVTIHHVESAVFRALEEYPWPGNVRELEHVLQRAVIYCHEGVLTLKHLPPHVITGMAGPGAGLVRTGTPLKDRRKNLGDQVATSERDIIEQALFRNEYSRTNTARDLGISRVTLYNKIKKLGIPLEPPR